ncbi:MAG: hypothetical protein KJ601_02785 [Nanoarchaeota archaeon]|nr:hypothetical protein [Nanoarchaeota archaeon]
MKLRKAIKRIAALGAGATLVGATLMGAMAADLSGFAKDKSPFIAGGKFAGVLVVGDKAAAEDVIGVTDIATSLQFAATTGAGSADNVVVTVEGDAWKVGTSSKTLELSENPTTLGVETIRNITNSIGADELEALGDGEIDNDKGTSPYHQYFNFERSTNADTGYVQFVEDTDLDVTDLHLVIPSDSVIANYEVEFTTDFESDIGTRGTANLDDYEDESIQMIGQDFTIVQAGSSDDDAVKLTLMSGPIVATMNEGETKTFKINDKEYEVSVPIITDTGTIYVKLVINGEITNKLTEAQTEKLQDNTYIGIKDILPNEAGDVTLDQVEFYLGAEKVVLEDTNITTKAAGSKKLEVNGEQINDVAVHIVGTDDASTIKISTIFVNMTADEDFYVATGKKLSEIMDEPQALFTSNWDIEFQGLTASDTEEISVKSSGSREYDLNFMDGAGNSVKMPLVYAHNSTHLRLGDRNYNLTINESNVITKKDYLVLNDDAQDDGEENTYVLQYLGCDATTDDSPEIRFKDLGSGDSITKTLKTDNTTAIRLGGTDYKIFTWATANDQKIKVDLDGSGALGTNKVNINTKYGQAIALAQTGTIKGSSNRSNGLGTTMTLTFTTPDTNDFENANPNAITFAATTAATDELRGAFGGGLTLITPEDEEEVQYGYTSMGAKITFKEPSGSPDELIMDYPKTQRTPLVYFTAGVTKVTSAETSGEAVTIARIEVGATKLASEVSDVTAQNIIAVGGPCANSVAAEVKGNPADCTEGYEPGVGMIELLDNGDNVAMVVAGYSAADTRNAAQVIANAADYADDLVGTKVEVSKVGSTLTVAQPAAEEATE